MTLYGLVLVPQRTVHYGPINPRESREIFVRSALVEGEWRTEAPFFRHNRRLIAIKNHVHSIEEIKQLTLGLNWNEVEFMELKVDETLKHYYEEQNALHIYRRFRNTPIICGWRLKKA